MNYLLFLFFIGLVIGIFAPWAYGPFIVTILIVSIIKGAIDGANKAKDDNADN